MALSNWVRLFLIAALLLRWSTPGKTQAQSLRPPHPIIVGYFPQGGLRSARPFYVRSLIDSGAIDKLDQIDYSQGAVYNGRCSLADPDADLSAIFTRKNSVSGRADSKRSHFRGYFHQLEELKHRYPHMKLLISLEGQAPDFANDAQPENRAAFVTSCVDTFLRGHFAPGIVKPGLFDGIDVDWESPQEKDAPNFLALLQELRREMDAVRPGLVLSVAVDQSPQALAGTDFAKIATIVDQVGVMNYDYAGPWSQTTGLLAPLFTEDPHNPLSVETSIAAYKAAGVPPGKILMGMPFYGYSWTEVETENSGLRQSGKADKEDRSYHHIREISSDFDNYRDEVSQAPWLFDGDTFWTYEDPVSIRFKASYAAHQHLGGLMIWELSGDTSDAELLNVAYRSLHDPLEAQTFVEHKRKHAQLSRPSSATHEDAPGKVISID
jgi:chitinase